MRISFLKTQSLGGWSRLFVKSMITWSTLISTWVMNVSCQSEWVTQACGIFMEVKTLLKLSTVTIMAMTATTLWWQNIKKVWNLTLMKWTWSLILGLKHCQWPISCDNASLSVSNCQKSGKSREWRVVLTQLKMLYNKWRTHSLWLTRWSTG